MNTRRKPAFVGRGVVKVSTGILKLEKRAAGDALNRNLKLNAKEDNFVLQAA